MIAASGKSVKEIGLPAGTGINLPNGSINGAPKEDDLGKVRDVVRETIGSMGGIMKKLGIKPGQVVSNPYARAFSALSEADSNDHEVSMAKGSLEAIVNHATELMEKLGNEEKDIPGWIQDHISKSENYIQQANDQYHEYGKNESINESKFYAFWKDDKIEIYGNSLWDAKQKAITQLKVPKSKVGLLAIVNASEHDKGSFKFD
jgi:hypothetical protein